MLRKHATELNGALALLGAVAYSIGRLKLPVTDSEIRLQGVYIAFLVGGACALSLALGGWLHSSLKTRWGGARSAARCWQLLLPCRWQSGSSSLHSIGRGSWECIRPDLKVPPTSHPPCPA
jgi:hypothetical protein